MVLMLASGKSDPSRHATLRWAALLRALVALPIVLGCARAYGADPTAVCPGWRRSSACKDKWTHAAQVNFNGDPSD